MGTCNSNHSSSLNSKQAEVCFSIGLAFERKEALENKNIKIKENSYVKSLTKSGKEFSASVESKSFEVAHIEKFKYIPASTTESFAENLAGNLCDVSTRVNNLPDRAVEHTLEVAAYLKNRLSSTLIEFIQKGSQENQIEFYLDLEERLIPHYNATGYKKLGAISSPNSTKFFLFYNEETNSKKIVVAGIHSISRLNHQILQFHYSGLNVEEISVIGDLDNKVQKNSLEIDNALEKLPACKKRVLFIGSRRSVMDAIGRKISDFTVPAIKEAGRSLLSPEKISAGGADFDVVNLRLNGEDIQIIALHIPNGDAAYHVTKVFLKHGFQHVVMCGAGGRLGGDAKVGDYMSIESATYGDSQLNLNSDIILLPQKFIHLNLNSKMNVTVNSPLDEDMNWLSKNEKKGCVDVETYHIFQALIEGSQIGKGFTVTPGMFVSDVIGLEPLSEKLSGSNAGKNMEQFVLRCLETIFNSDLASLQLPTLEEVVPTETSEIYGSLPNEPLIGINPENIDMKDIPK